MTTTAPQADVKPTDIHWWTEISLLFVLISLWFIGVYHAALFQGDILYFRDILHTYQPLFTSIKTRLWAGELPLWNALLYGGTPQLAAAEPAILYPGNLLFWLLDFHRALIISLWLHHLWAALGVYALVRQYYSWSARAALAAGLVFSLSGILVSMNNLFPLMFTAVWLPWLYWLYHRLLHRWQPLILLAFGLCYAAQILSGHLELVYVTSLFLLVSGLIHLCYDRSLWKGFLCTIWAMGCGILSAAAQLMPTFEFLRQSSRQSGLALNEAQLWSLHPARLPELFLPGWSGDLLTGQAAEYLGEQAQGGMVFLISLYLGLMTLIWLIYGLINYRQSEKPRHLLLWAGVMIFFLMIALGKVTPLYALFYQLPGMGFFRYPVKFLIFFSLAWAILAGWGIEVLYRAPVSRVWYGLWATTLGIFICLLGGIWRLELDTWFRSQWFWALTFGGGMAGVMLLKGRFKELSFILLFVLFLGDTALAQKRMLWLASPALFNKPSPIFKTLKQVELQSQPQYRLLKADENSRLPAALVNQYPLLLGTMVYHHQAMNLNLSLNGPFANAFGGWAARPARLKTLYQHYLKDRAFRPIFEDLMGVQYLHDLSLENDLRQWIDSHPKRYHLLTYDPVLDAGIWRIHPPQPRVHFKTQVKQVPNEAAALDVLLNAPQNGFDPTQSVVLFEEHPKVPPSNTTVIPRILENKAQKLKIEVATPVAGYLVVGDTFYPGWRAERQQKPQPILQANYFQRAVYLPPGTHRVTFTYQPTSFQYGLYLSLLGLLILLSSLFFPVTQSAE